MRVSFKQKLLSGILSFSMLFNSFVPAFASEVNIEPTNPNYSTMVEYTGEGEEYWELSVPAELSPGGGR